MWIAPYLILIVAIFYTLRSKPGPDLLPAVFLLPWYAFEIDIGVGLTQTQLLLITVLVKRLLYGELDLLRLKGVNFFSLLLFLGLLGAAGTWLGDIQAIAFEGGVFRNGFLRYLTIASLVVVTFLPIFLVQQQMNTRSLQLKFVSIFIHSLILLSLLACLQSLFYMLSGVDLFPIGLFHATEDEWKSAISFYEGSSGIFRPSSFGGEPKGLAMSLVCGLVLIWAFRGNNLFKNKTQERFTVSLFLLVIILTQSTSGFFSLAVILGLLLVYQLRPYWFTASTVSKIYFAFGFGLLLIYFAYVLYVPLVPWRESGFIAEDLWGYVISRTFARVGVEDMDYILVDSIKESAWSLFFGRGFGLAHLFTDPYIPYGFRHYLEGVIISPKSGVTFWLVNCGFLGLALVLKFYSSLTPSLQEFPARADRKYWNACRFAVLCLVVLSLFRMYSFDISLMFVALLGRMSYPSDSKFRDARP